MTRPFDHTWWWRSKLPERKDQPCRVLVRAPRMNSIAVEFEDGFCVCTSRYAVRKTKSIGTARAEQLPLSGIEIPVRADEGNECHAELYSTGGKSGRWINPAHRMIRDKNDEQEDL